tara:strand:- start:8 stop:196 length:189 start_codon:yes stop_codon:yes gene_type:complete
LNAFIACKAGREEEVKVDKNIVTSKAFRLAAYPLTLETIISNYFKNATLNSNYFKLISVSAT